MGNVSLLLLGGWVASPALWAVLTLYLCFEGLLKMV